MSQLKAPNGKPSNLTPEQWKLVRTPQFKAWFGDWENDPENASKVVDENGEPLVVYHGTQASFNKFKKQNTYFTDSKKYIKSLIGKDAEVKEVFINSKKVCDLTILGFREISFAKFTNECVKQGAKKNYADYEELEDYVGNDKYMAWQFFRSDEPYLSIMATNWLEYFFDVIIYKNSGLENSKSKTLLFISSRKNKLPNQIKLADGSNTTFDGNNPDIRFAEGGLVEGKEYKGKLVKLMLRKASFDNIDFFEYIQDDDNYIFRQVDVKKLYAKDSTLADFVNTSKDNFQENKYDYRWELQHPIVVGDTDWEKGIVLDGYHRISQTLANKENKLYAFVKQPKNETDKYFHYQFQNGGKTKRYMKKIKRGGITYGKSHAEGGIPVKNQSTGDMLEVEGGEGIVNKRSMASKSKVKLNGKDLTICQAVSELNQMEGGVQFSCEDVSDRQFIRAMAKGGELDRGTRTEQEHIQVLKDLYAKRITPKQASERIAKDHLKEDSQYYSKLARMEGKITDGGNVLEKYSVTKKPDENLFLYIIYTESGEKVPSKLLPKDIGYGKIENKFEAKRRKYDPSLGLRDAQDIVRVMNKREQGKMADGGKTRKNAKTTLKEAVGFDIDSIDITKL